MLIGISGYIGSGKDTLGQIVQFLITNEIRKDKGAAIVPWHTYIDPKNQSMTNFRNWDESGWRIMKFAAKLKQAVSLFTGYSLEDLEKQEVKLSELGPEWNRPWFVDRETKRENPIFGVQDMESYKRRFKHRGDIVMKPMTVRELLQLVGTDALRNQVHENIHVNALFADYKPHDKGKAHDGLTMHELYGGKICQNCKCKFSGYKRQPFCRECTENPEVQFYPNWLIPDTRFPNEGQGIKDRGGIIVRINRPVPIAEYETLEQHVKKLHPSETSMDEWPFDYTINNTAGIPELIEEARLMLIHFKLLRNDPS